MIENWRDLVGYEEIQSPVGKVHYLNGAYINDELTFNVLKTEVNCTLTEAELCDELDRILTSFSTTCDNDTIAVQRASNNSVRTHHRGIPKTRYKNAQYYKGSTSYDSPVVVAGFEGKFGIYVHPKFDDYGFMIEDTK